MLLLIADRLDVTHVAAIDAAIEGGRHGRYCIALCRDSIVGIGCHVGLFEA